MREKLLRFWIGLAIGGLVSWITFQVNSQEVEELSRRISDAFFCGGLLCLCLGGLMFARNKGTFDILAYGLGAAFRLHVPGAAVNPPKDPDYVSYRQRKASQRSSSAPLLLAGAVYLLLSVVWFVLYMKAC